MSPKSPLILTSPSLTRKFAQSQRDRNRKMTRAQAAKLQAVMTQKHLQNTNKEKVASTITAGVSCSRASSKDQTIEK